MWTKELDILYSNPKVKTESYLEQGQATGMPGIATPPQQNNKLKSKSSEQGYLHP